MIAEIFFISGWLIALLKAASSEPNASNWVNVEAHSVAFSALYLWVTSAVVMGSAIGASQTESSIPRILQGFEYHVTKVQEEKRVKLDPQALIVPAQIQEYRVRRPSAGGREDTGWCRTSSDRATYGGVYSWKPTKWRHVPRQFDIDTGTLISYSLIATVVVGSGFLTAAILSSLVSPRGPSCRHVPESFM